MAGAKAAAQGDVEKGVGREWAQQQPALPRTGRYFLFGNVLGCCPPYVVLAVVLGPVGWALGLLGLAAVTAAILLVVVLCCCPVSSVLAYFNFWSKAPWNWHVDLYAKVLYLGYQRVILRWTQPDTSSRFFPVAQIRPKGKLKKLQIAYALNIAVPIGDEEEFFTENNRQSALFAFIEANTSRLRMTDRFETFADDEDPVEYVMKQVGNIYPVIYQDWSDKKSDEALTRLCFYGLGAHRLDSVMEDGVRRFVVRADSFATLPVRMGFARYGGDCYFDETWRPLKIVDCGCADKTDDGECKPMVTRPGDAKWEEAKFRFRSSLITLVTMVDHLYAAHLQTANIVVTAAREQLSPDHPIRRFLLPFSFRTITVNDNAHFNLVSPQSLAPRVFAFTDYGLRLAFAAAPRLMMGGHEVPVEEGGPFLNRAKYSEYMKEKKGVDTEYYRQSAKLFTVMRQFVVDYLACYYSTPDMVVKDAELMAFARQIAFQLDYIEPVRSKVSMAATLGAQAYDTMVDVITEFLFTVTAGHEQVGAIEAYAQDVSFCATKWLPGKLVGTKQTATAQALLMSLTSTPMPPLLGSDWAHLFPDATPRAGVKTPKQVFDDFQAGLKGLAEEADAYNDSAASRNFPENFPLYTMNPRVLETSAAV